MHLRNTEKLQYSIYDIVYFINPLNADQAAALSRIEKKLDDLATENVPMSEVTSKFAKPLLDYMNVKLTNLMVNVVGHESGPMKKYKWQKNESEIHGQEGCKQILQEEIQPLYVDDDEYGLFDVRGRLLWLRAGKRHSDGFSDLALGPKVSMQYAETTAKDLMLPYAAALIELKTAKAELKPGQLVLQLLSFSKFSNLGQGVVVLGTDCVDKWRLLHFADYNHIAVQPYKCGKKCLADFKMLVEKGQKRKESHIPPPRLANIYEGDVEEDEQDFRLDDFGMEESDRDKAISREAMLQKLASVLGDMYGETLEVPSWALASESCSSYYT